MFYALRHKEKKALYVGIITRGSEEDFQNDVQAEFILGDYVPYITNRVGLLESVLDGTYEKVEWYNSSPERPEYCFMGRDKTDLQNYEVIKLGVIE